MTYNKKHIGIILVTFSCAFFALNFLIGEQHFETLNQNNSSKLPNIISIITSDKQVHKFNVLIANTPELQEKGLGDRNSLDKSEAMLFIFNENKKHYFWMKDMHFPIDMVWLDSHKRVIYIEKNVATSTYPSAFGPAEPSLYVIEFNTGTADKIVMHSGDLIDF